MAETHITVLDQIDQIEDLLLDGTRVPFSGGRLVNEQDAIEVIDAVREALPAQLGQAVELLRQREEFIAQARKQAEEIVATGKREREQLISSSSIRQEAEKQAAEMREQTRQHCDQLLIQGRQQAAAAEQEQQARLAQLEHQFATRRQQLEQEAAERNRLLLEQHERNRQQAMAELEQIRQEGLRVQRESQAEAERLHNDALQFRQQTQQQCDALVVRSRKEAASVSEGANRYAEQVLGELEGRLKELGQVVAAGRRELVRLQVPEQAEAGVAPAAPQEQPSAAPRRRRSPSVLRQLAG
jgi:F0F1-type ATP synthase membrane subunit b/b'